MKHRKITLLLFTQIALSLYTFSQDRFSVGVATGPGLSTVYGGGYQAYYYGQNTSAVSASAGVSFEYKVTKLFSVRTGLYYERKSYRYSQDGGLGGALTDQYQNNLHYFSLPLLAQISGGRKVIVFGDAGLSANYLLLAKEKAYYEAAPQVNIKGGEFTTTVTNNFNLWDVGVVFGAGIKMPIKYGFAVTVEWRNNLGLLSIQPDYATRFFTSTFLVGFTYSFGSTEKAAK